MPLTELCLQVKLLSLGSIKQFLSKASPFNGLLSFSDFLILGYTSP